MYYDYNLKLTYMPFKCQMEELKIKFAFVEETIVTRGLIVSIITATYNKINVLVHYVLLL